ITKTGTGTQTFAGTNTYTGNTTIQGGALMLTGAGAWNPALNGPGVTNINGGKLMLNYATDADPFLTVQAKLSASYTAGTPWATGQFHISTPDPQHGLGWKDDSANAQVLVAYTYYGDADLSGTVSSSDFAALAQNFNSTSATWLQGDFNYDGRVNALDFSL